MTEIIKIDLKKDKEVKLAGKEWNPDKAKMKLANNVLLYIILLTLLSMFIYVNSKELGEPLIEICKIGLLPIVTLILGYYFSKKD